MALDGPSEKPVAKPEAPPAWLADVLTQPDRGRVEPVNAVNAKGQDTGEKSTGIKHAVVDMGSSLTAGVTGTVVFSLATSMATRRFDKALTIPMALAAGAVTKYGTKALMEHAMLDKKDHTLSSKDLAWGAVDALAGVGAAKAERFASTRFLNHVGQNELGKSIGLNAQKTGRMLVDSDLKVAFAHSAVRGVAGGATGAFIWSAPHRVDENWQGIKSDVAQGNLGNIGKTGLEIGRDTFMGAGLGTAFGTIATGIGRRQEIVARAQRALDGPPETLRLDTYHINDFHSNTEKLPRLATKLEELTGKSQAQGRDARFVVPGDIESGRVNFSFTQGGKYENEALMRMGAKEIVPGNHPYDAPGGKFDIPRYPEMMQPLLQKHPDVSLIAANLDVSAYPKYTEILKPYTVREVEAPWGKIKVGSIGVTTEEGALGSLKYQDAAQVAVETAKKLKAEGVDVVQIYSHLGLGEDIKMAQTLVDNDIRVAGILGGHSHDALPRPLWVGKGDKAIPIVQAGHSGNWLGEFNQAIRRDGGADRWATTSKLHPITESIKEDPGIRKYLDDNLTDINALKAETYDARASAPYSAVNARNRETTMGNLMADAIADGLRKRLGDEAPQAVMVHSGGIRTGIKEGVELSRLDLANMVMNAGKREGEVKELVRVTLTGEELKNALEYGVRDRAAQPAPSVGSRLKSIMKEPPVEHTDESGNFVQVSGLKYTYDATKSPLQQGGTGGERIVDLQIANANGVFEKVDPKGTYTIATRFHPVDKWHKFGIFGDGKTIEDVHRAIDARPLQYSQVDMIGEYIKGKTLDPSTMSRVEGRITDLTPQVSDDVLRPARSMAVAPTLSGFDAVGRALDARDK